MGQIWVKEFTGGLDARKMVETSPGGTLIRAVDGHITSGGEFEKRAAFVNMYELPQNVMTGLAADANGLVAFGSDAPPAMPAQVRYQRLAPAVVDTTLTRVLSTDLFAGKIYATTEFSNGGRYQYYNGLRSTTAPAGSFVRTIGSKMYTLVDSITYFSAIQDPSLWGSGTGAGFIDMSTHSSGSETLQALAKYQNFAAIFAENNVQIWFFDPDPTLNRQIQVLGNTGTQSPRSVTQFSDNDLFYLSKSGLRSLRARDASNAAATSDIGVPVDKLITEKLRSMTALEKQYQVFGLIEPREGRYWLVMKDIIFVFSYFPGSKVAAWTIYNLGFAAEGAAVFRDVIYLRSGNIVYAYGGVENTQLYDATEATAQSPYLDAGDPTQIKELRGIDMAAEGGWAVEVAMDPRNRIASDKIGAFDDTTYSQYRIPAHGRANQFSMIFRSKGTGPARLGSFTIHFEGGGPDGS